MINGCPGFRIQPDWDKSINEGESEIWFHQYQDGVTKHHKLEKQGSVFIPDANSCQCYYYPPNVLQLRLASTGVKRTFQSPDTVIYLPYSKERPPRVHLSCMDVSPSGELVLSASSEKSVDLWEASNGQIRRTLEGHVAEVYRCRFFPSGLAALTAGADMQLKIWCLVTGRCAATLAPGLAGGVTRVASNSEMEPGGHRAGIMDMGIIHRGRNIVSVDRDGWLRLWDVGSQICLSAIPLTPRATNRTSSPHSVIEETTSLAVKKFGESSISFTDVPSEQTWFQCLETVSQTAVEVGTSDALVAVGMGSEGLVRLYDLNARSRGCVAQFQLPTASGSVESCSFVQAPLLPSTDPAGEMVPDSNPSSTQSSPPGSPVSPVRCDRTATTAAFGEYGLAAGGQNGEVGCWDIRYPKRCLLQLTHEKGAVVQLCLLSDPPNQSGHAITMIVGRSDGRVLLYYLGPEVWSSEAEHSDPAGLSRVQWSTLELTGINCEPVRGMAVVPQSSRSGLCGIWTASHSGVFRFYRSLATSTAFN
ncbi:Proteasomal ATPase associated factor 1 [Fasciola gigantica]|uniref:Proteasomal ATPase associated factor 1 n=1 Tax=Fasciola gigantica TaxID=46835 RepID=A0A504Z9U4_FASGI|nr:Proteasomal ATPase associated factor 1 [Fasciola gigantica]